MTINRRGRLATLATATIATTMMTLGAASGTAMAAPDAFQRVKFAIQEKKDASILDVYATDNGSWITLSDYDDDAVSEIRKCDFDACTPVEVPNIGVIEHLSGLSSTQIWAVSETGVLEFDGQAWKNMPFLQEEGYYITGIKAITADNVWVVSAQHMLDQARPHTRIQRWDGSQWSSVNGLPHTFSAQTVDASGPDNVWVMGDVLTSREDTPEVAHWDGVRWTAVELPTDSRIDNTYMTALKVNSPEDVWVGGGAPDFSEDNRAFLLHFDGFVWREVPLDGEQHDYTEIVSIKHDGTRLMLHALSENMETSNFLISDDNGATWQKLKVTDEQGNPMTFDLWDAASAIDLHNGVLWIATSPQAGPALFHFNAK